MTRYLFFFQCLCVLLPACCINKASYAQSECATKDEFATNSSLGFSNQVDSGQTWKVPVVFHVLYKTNEQNVSDKQILSLLATLNKDFLKLNTDVESVEQEFKGLIGNPKVNFVLATTEHTPNSIIRILVKKRKYSVKSRVLFQQSPIINSQSVLNVFICNLNRSNGFFPSKNRKIYDAVVIDFEKAIGGARTLTHEVGHWLNLRHIFSGDCENKDGVNDTPAQKKHAHTCPLYPVRDCNAVAMTQNFMDYSSCRSFFTIGQVERMRTYIINNKTFAQ